MTAPAPDHDAIEARLAGLATGRLDKETVDRWAARWITDDTIDWDPLSWWALNLLHGADLRSAPDEYLHDDRQLSEWLAEFRHRRGGH